MKKPILFNVDGSQTAPIVPIFAQGDYDVYVGSLEPEKLPMYVVINRNTTVAEFTTEVTLAYKGFLDHVAPTLQDLANDSGQVPLNFSLRN